MNDNPKPTYIHGAVCPVPLQQKKSIVMGHGSGGKMMHDLIQSVFLPPFENPILQAGNDAGIVSPNYCTRLAISTDSHVVWPLFFAGGDIGRLAVCGTVNDLAMMGATPRFLTAGFILEEGFRFEILEQIVASMQRAAEEAEVLIVAGDTKVVENGKADGIYINTSGIGLLPEGLEIAGANAKPGDVVVVSGTLGDHGIAVLSARGDLGFDAQVQSDIAPLNHMVSAMLDVSEHIHVLRDPTRGGLATSLNQIAQQSNVGILLDEEKIPVNPAVQSACEMLGFDPLYVANEGKFIVIVGQQDADEVLTCMHAQTYGEQAAIIGEITASPQGKVLMKTPFGSKRIVDTLSGEMLPRIC